MTSRQVLTLLASHLAVLGLAYQISRHSHATGENDGNSPRAATKVSDRSSSSATSGSDGAELLASFMETDGRAGKSRDPLYDSLKETLPVASNPEAAAREAIKAFAAYRWSDKLDPYEGDRLRAEAAVRVLHWMRDSGDPGKVLELLAADPAAHDTGFLYHIAGTAAADMATEQGVLKAWPWLSKTPQISSQFSIAAVNQMKAGGGLDLITQLESAVKGTPAAKLLQSFSYTSAEDKGTRTFYMTVGISSNFADRQKLLDLAMGQESGKSRNDLLMGFARSSTEAAHWLLEQEGLDPTLVTQLQETQSRTESRDTALSYDQRIDAMLELPDTKSKDQPDRQAMLNDMVHGDLGKILNEGRDWRYEFRHGVSSLDDVVNAIRTAMPNVPPEAEEAFTVSLYRQLVEEDAKKALPLLDSLPEDRRRDALFNSTWLSMVNIDPNDFLSSFSSLPEPETPTEKDLRTKGWNWKARGFLMRYGDDYVEWVKEMPEGIDKQTAMNSLIWATREENPAEARKLSDQLFPPKADETK